MIRLLAPALLALAAALFAAGQDERAELPDGWFKGNTHTHTLWSDGNGAPELVAAWYREHGYHFLVLSDHNILSRGEAWFPVEEEKGRLRPEHVAALVARFGEGAVDLREEEGRAKMRLKNMPELRARFEAPGEFLFLEGEEITDSFQGAPVHVNGVHLAEQIPPQGGASLIDVAQRNLDAVREQGERLDRPVLAHLNHPNFGWAFTAEELATLEGETFFEVYNGHSAVRNHGDAEHLSTERLWDVALTLRLSELGLPPLYGVATDDSHDYHGWGVGHTNPGRGWVVVRAGELTPRALLGAMHAGDFYASTGVVLEDFAIGDGRYEVRVRAERGVTYTARFFGTRRGAEGPGPAGEVLFETDANPAVYELRGDELYVRCVVVSSRAHPNPFAEGDLETAWLQPFVPGR